MATFSDSFTNKWKLIHTVCMYVYFICKSVNILNNTTQEYILYNILQRLDTSSPQGLTCNIYKCGLDARYINYSSIYK